MARRKKGGQRLIEMARKKRKSSSAKKTAVRPKRVKGGQKLSELAGITPASRKRAAQKRKQARATKEDRLGGRYSVTPLKPKPKAKPKAKPIRKYTPKEKADYEKRYKETARKPDPAFTRTKPKPKATTKPVVKPPKGSVGPSYHRRKGKGHGFGSKTSTAGGRSRTTLQTPKGAGRSLRADLTKQQKTLVAEGKKLSKQFGLKIPAPSVRTAEKLGLPIELAGWVALAIATRGKLGTGKKVAGKWSKLKELFGKKPGVMGGVGEVRAAGAAARGSGLGAARTAEQITKAKRAKERADKLRKAKKAATSGGGYGKPG